MFKDDDSYDIDIQTVNLINIQMDQQDVKVEKSKDSPTKDDSQSQTKSKTTDISRHETAKVVTTQSFKYKKDNQDYEIQIEFKNSDVSIAWAGS